MMKEEQHNRREADPMLKALLDTIKQLGDTMHQGFRDSNARIDDIYKQVGKIEGLDSKVNSFIQLMEKMNDHAEGDIEDLKKRNSSLAERVAKLEGKDIASSARSGMVGKGFDVLFRSWVGPVLAAATVAYIMTNVVPRTSSVTIHPPAAMMPPESQQGDLTNGDQTTTRRSQ